MVTYSRLLIVGGGRGQLHLYEAAKELQLPTMMLDSRPNVLAASIADHVVQTRPEHFFSTVEDLSETLIISDQSDFAQDWAFRFQKRVKQPVGMDSELTDTGYNKALLRAHLERSRLKWLNPDWIVASNHTLPQISDKIPFKMGQEIVMKPLNGQGSAGVKFEEFQGIDTLTRMLDHETGMRIFEERFSGPQISVDSISVGGACSITAVGAKRKFRKAPALDETIVFGPLNLSPEVLDAQKQLVRELGIMQGFLHAEYALTPLGVRLIEFGLRGGGGGISSHVAPYLTDSSITRDFISSSALSEKMVLPRIVPERRAMVRFYSSFERWRRAKLRLATIEPRAIPLLCRLETDFSYRNGLKLGLRRAVIVVGCETEEDLLVLDEALGDR